MTTTSLKAVAQLDISAELLAEVCKGLEAGMWNTTYRIVKNGLPLDAVCVGAYTQKTAGGQTHIRLLIESNQFKDGQLLESPLMESVREPDPTPKSKPCKCGGMLSRDHICLEHVVWQCDQFDCRESEMEEFKNLGDDGWAWMRMYFTREDEIDGSN